MRNAVGLPPHWRFGSPSFTGGCPTPPRSMSPLALEPTPKPGSLPRLVCRRKQQKRKQAQEFISSVRFAYMTSWLTPTPIFSPKEGDIVAIHPATTVDNGRKSGLVEDVISEGDRLRNIEQITTVVCTLSWRDWKSKPQPMLLAYIEGASRACAKRIGHAVTEGQKAAAMVYPRRAECSVPRTCSGPPKVSLWVIYRLRKQT